MGKIVPRNLQRISDAITEDLQKPRLATTGASPLAGPIFKGDHRPPPKACDKCARRGVRMLMLVRGEEECSHIECPNRRSVTAAPVK